MKTILLSIVFLSLLSCPLILCAQSKVKTVQLPLVDDINSNAVIKQFLKLDAQRTNGLNTFNVADNRELLDSTYQIYYYSPTNIARTVRKYFKYDERGNQVLSVEYDGEHTSSTSFNTCEKCIGGSFKTELKIDENTHTTERGWFICNSADKEWVKIRKSYDSYDDNGIMTGYISYFLNEDNDLWSEPVKVKYTYNEHGDLTDIIYTNYDSITNQWNNNGKYEYLYNNNLNSKRTVYNWNQHTSQWENSTKEEFEYDSNGNDTLRTAYNWDKQTSQWIGFFRYEYSYSSEGKISMTTNSKWDTITSQWINVNKTDYLFDANGNETDEIYSEWDVAIGKWIGRQKYVSLYNENGFLSSETTYLGWDKTDGTWDLSSKDDYEYDSNGNNTSITSYYWNLPENTWSIRTKTNNYYSLPKNAPLTVDAGSDIMVCFPAHAEDRTQFTGVASGGVEPYSYSWSGKQIKYLSPDDSIWVYASHLLNDTTLSNPSFRSMDAPWNWVTFYLKVKDAAGNTATDSVKVIDAFITTTAVNYLPLTIHQGDSIQLWGNQLTSNFPMEYTLFPTAGLRDPKNLKGWAKPDTSTTYYLQAESAAGCVEKFYYRRIEVLPTASSNHTSEGKAVQCYWNQGELVIQVPHIQQLPFEVSITTTNGSLIHKGNYSQREIRLGNIHLKKHQVYIVAVGNGKEKQVVKVMGN